MPTLKRMQMYFPEEILRELKKAVVLIQKNPVKSNMGVHRVLVSLLDFKSSVACQKRARWVRFPHAPARNIVINLPRST